MDCQDMETLWTRWADRELTAAERAELDGHLAECPECGEAFADYGSAIEGVGRMAPEPLGPDFAARVVRAHTDSRSYCAEVRPRFRGVGAWRLTAAVAAALFAGLLLGRAFRAPQPDSTPPPAVASAPVEPRAAALEPEHQAYVNVVDICLDQHQMDRWDSIWMDAYDQQNAY